MAEPLHLQVWTLSRTLVDIENVEWVHVTLAEDRPLTIWPGHAPLLAETVAGAMRYAQQGETHTVDLPSAIMHVERNAVRVYIATTLDEEGWGEEARAGRLERLVGETLAVLGGAEGPKSRSPA